MERKPFSKAIEERPGLTMRRLTQEEEQALNGGSHCLGECVGIFNVYGNKKMLAFIAMEDIFDENGNRFYND